MSEERLKVWAIAGSLRADSWNRKLLEAAAALAPEDVEVHISDLLPEIPFFNEDLTGNEPAVVQQLRAEVAAADAVMIATPEYNGMVPGVLKNMLDWIAFPLFNCVLMDKPVALMGASGSKIGTARAQVDLRQMFMYSRAMVVPPPEVLVNFAFQAFDDEGRLVDPMFNDRIAHQFAYLKKFARFKTLDEVTVNS
ncbi:NAD(P)H-dependent oxidoreductase [Nocardioides sp. CGMCC 1.13656]|uniref:NADPH-dependent FMN reductase n=1 Tax=Nocardioides TaxID=1839 RepID=UPI0012FC8852|nr:NAD(P)H-dependent oxidoreductase [Nocardioides sp. CGMCC 1.13656]MBA2953802.1 NAD(P)H-dependent oxidoreductase [Nocardioides sp. CGMCC 1.13656]